MSWAEELEDYIGRIREKADARLTLESFGTSGLEAEVALELGYAKLPDIAVKFSRFADGHPTSCEHMKGKLQTVFNTVAAGVPSLDAAEEAFGDWYDLVANPCRRYLVNCVAAVGWRCDYARTFAGIANLQQEVLTTVRADVRSIADATLTALGQPIEEDSGSGLGEALAVVGVIAAVGVAVATPWPGDEVAAVAMGADLLNRVVGVVEAGRAAVDALSEPEIRGRYTAEILGSAFSVLDALWTAVAELEVNVGDALKELHLGFQANEAAINPSRDAVDLNALDANEARIVDLDGIRLSGTYLRDVVTQNQQAAQQVAALEENEPHAFEGDLHSPPLPQWQEVRESFRKIFEVSAMTLEDTAVTLEAIADTYEDGEAANGELFGNIARILEES
jgi:hypothetical protein